MKVKELIKKLEAIGYDDNTTITFGIFRVSGEWFDFKVEDIEKEDDDIGIILESNKSYDNSVSDYKIIELSEDLHSLIDKYC